MAISTLTFEAADHHENLKYVVLDSPLSTVDGKLSTFKVPNSTCSLVMDFEANGTGNPRECIGHVKVTDGNAQVVLDIPGAVCAIEAGVDDGAWKTMSSLSIRGISTDGEMWILRSIPGVAQGGRSIVVEGGVSDLPGLKGFRELAVWSQS